MSHAPRDREAGYTLIELIVSLTILAVVTGALSAAFITTNNANANTSQRIHQSNDAQLTGGFWTADAQAAGGTNPYTAQSDPLLGVSKSDDGGCATGGGSLVARFKWREWKSRGADTSDTYTTRVASYVYQSTTHELERRTCADTTAKGAVTLATRLASAPTVTCNGGAVSCPSFPDTVTIAVAEATTASAPTAYSFSLTASLRAVGQTKPDSTTAASTPLLALGSSTCTSGATGLSATGSGSVFVNGQAVVNATDVGGCHAMTLNTNFNYIAGGTSILAGGSLLCTGPGTCPPTTTDPVRIGDPYAYLTPPAGTCSGGSNPASPGGSYSPGVYPQPVSVSGSATFAPGNYVFCGGITFSGSGTVTATGVLFYIKGGTTPFSVAGGITLSMSASTVATNPYAGLLIWNATVNTLTINGGATVTTYGGAIYSPNADVQLNGTQSINVGSIVAKRILFSGSATTNILGGDPTKPSGPVLTATTSSTTLRQVHLSWVAPTYAGTTPITGYEYRANRVGAGFGAWTTVPGGVVLAFDDVCGTSDTASTTCSYQVRAVNGSGGGAPSNTATAASLADTGAPIVSITAPTANAKTGVTPTFSGIAGNLPGDSGTVVVKVYNGATCTGSPALTYNVTRAGAAWSVTVPPAAMTSGPKCVVATQTDWLANTGTSASVPFTAGQVTNVVLADANGQLAKGDTVAITFGQAMNPATLCPGWTGASRSSVTVTVTNGTAGANDILTVTDSACAFKFGALDLGSPNWVTATTSYTGSGGNASTAAFDATFTTLTIKVGNGIAGAAGVTAQTVTYTPNPAMKDSGGTAMSGVYSFVNQRF